MDMDQDLADREWVALAGREWEDRMDREWVVLTDREWAAHTVQWEEAPGDRLRRPEEAAAGAA